MNVQDFHGSLQRFSLANTVEDITQLCRFHCQQLGFDSFVYALRIPTHFSESRVVMVKGYPDAWLERYFERSYFKHDPVLKYCSQHIVPVRWSDLNLAENAASELFMREASEFGLRAGISMPVHSPHGELGILSMAVDRKLVAAREITQQAMPYVQLLAGYLHEAVRRVFDLTAQEAKPALSLREHECLRWAADGKSSWEIAQLLNVTERTVNFHLNNTMTKLDVCNRQHAVAKGTLLGLISPNPF